MRLRTGLAPADARLVIGLPLQSEAQGDNVGLLSPSLPADLPQAQKHGWISAARHTAAILYGSRGPVVSVVLTYRDGLSLAESQALGSKVAASAIARARS